MQRSEGRATAPFRVHQQQALDALAAAADRGVRRAWVVLPPGAGKTLVGLEVARRRGRPAVVLGPNNAIVAQWVRGWDELHHDDPAAAAGTERDLAQPFTALTYQSLATFDADDELDEDGLSRATSGRLLDDLHPHGRALVERLKALGDVTLVLDECHHLLEVWGRLLRELLVELPDSHVLGLTATPPDSLTREQHALVDELFGETVFTASIPAVVREGDLAPFAELAWFTTPTPRENDWLAEQGQRFVELTAWLTDPATGFLEWADRRFVGRSGAVVAWESLARDEPELTDAALRMVEAGLLALPEGARIAERHRHEPTADDWVLLLDDWVEHDRAHAERVGAVLPSVGYQLTRRGVRRGRSPVDRVLARSEAKTQALVEIVAAEHTVLGDRLRMLVLCDHERATATLPVDLTGVLGAEAGSATLALAHLEDGLPGLAPLLVTGRTVAGSDETLKALQAFVGDDTLSIVDGRLEGSWTSRDWVPWVTRFFEAGHTQALVGTRGLLGEGWDARAVTGLVDLTAATTTTAVVQTRGRALRVDPGWPEKVALTWTVVCVSEDHPRGDNDWQRFVRKHDGYYGLDADGDVVAGVAHVDAELSPYAPPPVDDFAALNARMLDRAQRREEIRAAWKVGTPYDDTLVHTVRITASRQVAQRREPAPVTLHGGRLSVRDRRPSPWRPHPMIAVGVVAALVAFLLDVTPAAVVGIGLATVLGLQSVVAVDRGRRLAEELQRPPSVEQIGYAVADGLRAAGLSPLGAEGVRVDVDELGGYRCALVGVVPAVSATFATALDEVVAPMASPRYVLPRWVRSGSADNTAGVLAALWLLRPDGEVWHTVPTVLGTTGERAQAFAKAWDHWVGGGPAIHTGSPRGEGVLVTHRGSDPFDVTTVLRTSWS